MQNMVKSKTISNTQCLGYLNAILQREIEKKRVLIKTIEYRSNVPAVGCIRIGGLITPMLHAVCVRVSSLSAALGRSC